MPYSNAASEKKYVRVSSFQLNMPYSGLKSSAT